MRKIFYIDGVKYDMKSKKGESEFQFAGRVALKAKEIEAGRVIFDRGTTVKQWAEEWLRTYKQDTVGLGQYQLYRGNLNNHIYPYLAFVRLRDVKPIHCQKILNNRVGHSKSHVSKLRQLLFQIFETAMDADLIAKNPAKNLTLPTAQDKGRRAITDYERKYILQVAETHKGGVWIKMILYCGLRPGETAALQVNNIDFKNNIIKVKQARKSKTNTIGSPKSMAGIRDVPIPEAYSDALKKYCKGKSPFDYVFVQETTRKRHTERSMNQLWQNFKRELNLAMGCKVYRNELIPPYPVAGDLVPYCLRHTYGTDLAAAGVPVQTIMWLMGHEDIDTTMIYAHKSTTAIDNAMQMVNNFHHNFHHSMVESGGKKTISE